MLNWFARKLQEVQKKDKTGQGGFTLIELLVVVIIIGILAAIAIPAFLNQRQNAQQKAAQANLRNTATAQQSFFTENGSFTSAIAVVAGANNDLTDFGYRPGDPAVTVVTPATGTGANYCMQAAGGGVTYKQSDADGRPIAASC